MKLRTRLFLWVGLIFLLAFGVSLYFETRSTDENLKIERKQLKEQILHLNEIRRQHIEDFLRVALSETQAQIDSLLFQISRDPTFGATLFLDPSSLKLVAPYHVAQLFKNDEWIDFIQTTKDNHLTALLIPIAFPMATAHLAPIDEKISWIVLDHDKEMQHPFIGVHLPTHPIQQKTLTNMIDERVETKWTLTVLFHPEALQNFAPKDLKPLQSEYGVDPAAFLANVQHGANYMKALKEKGESKQWIQKDIREKGGDQLFVGKPLDMGVKCLEQDGEMIDSRVIQLLQRADQAILLSILSSLFPGGAFGSDPFAKGAPKGLARFTPNNPAGHVILTDEAFFQKKAFDDAGYFQKHPGSGECQTVGPSIAVIAPENMERVFVGNTLQMQGKGAEGYLTIAIDMADVIQDLVLSSRMGAFLVNRGKVISAYDPEAMRLANPKGAVPFHEKMLQASSGVIEWRGTNYYYQQMTPFKGLDLHFFTFELEEKAFAIVHTIDAGSRQVIKKVAFDMRIIAVAALVLVLLLLHHVARRITKPISALARVTKQVAAGQLEDIEVPHVRDGREDEIAALCDSFAQMVIGLREKEKVKGVLNKVVSPEIAREIMKGQIHLGGEERKVTVLFADIRNFTGISLDMDPQKVIGMLNTCMTKISTVIDEFGGVIDKYVGDEVMALFGAPFEKEDSALKAIQCALKMVETLKIWNEERKKEGKVPIEMGIGIHTGKMIIGNMGAENRLNYTVIGSNVNFAARLCSAAKGMEILISKETLAEPHVEEAIEAQPIAPIELKGFIGTFSLYRVKGVKNV